MKFPVPKTLIGAALPIVLLNWLFGIGVIQYPIGRPRPIISAFWSIANILTFVSFVTIANFSRLMENEGAKLAGNNYRVTAYLFVVFIVVSICLGGTRAKIIRCVFKELYNINGRLKILGIPNDYEVLLKTQIIQLCIAFFSILIIMVLDFIYVQFEFPSEMSRFGFFMTYHYFLVFAFIVDFSFGVSIRYFGNRFRRLNVLLIESVSLGSNETVQATHDQLDNQFTYYSPMILEIHGNNSLSIRGAKKQWLLYVIKETRRIHRGLCITAMDMNRAFGMQLLLSMTLSFGLMITLLYSIYVGIAASALNYSDSAISMERIIGLLWVIFHAMKILVIVDSCETTSCEANRTGELIIKLLHTTASDEHIRNEINNFTLQLIQSSLNFTAHGFFNLNYSLVRGIIGSVTTYLVLMIQMQKIYELENVNTTPNSMMLVQTNGTNY